MRIALFSGNYNYLREGANQALNTLVRYLEEKAGHEVRVYSPITDTPAFEPVGTLVPVASVRLPIRGEFQLALGLPRSIRRDVERFAPDLIHVSTPDILGTRAQTFAKHLNIPVVASLHTLFETYLDYYSLGWARPVVEAHLRRFYRRSDHVLAPTPALVDRMQLMRGDGRASVWSRGVDRALFHPDRRDLGWRRARGIADDEIAILFFGRLVLEKGIATFVTVVDALQRRGIAVRPLIVGAGPARGACSGMRGVVATGHLQDVELATAVASGDIMLAPSSTETFGNVVLEAMASGLPVVSADVPSARALIEAGRTGFLSPSHDVEHYAATIEALVASADLRRSVSAAAREASEAYSWDAASSSVERAYRFTLQEHSRKTGSTTG
jgi:glycosyltransferase involved in cell wall biosynthesis